MDRLDQDAVLQKLRSRINKLIESGIYERAYLGKSRYRENFRILLGGGGKALVQIGAVDTVRQKGGIRIECNPAKFADGALWRRRQAVWWQPEELWQQACDALRDTGMFPPEAFDQPNSQAEQP